MARGGSKGIPLKNLQNVNGISLLGRSLDIIKKSNVFTEIWVSTDHPLIASEARKCNYLYSIYYSNIKLIFFKDGAKIHLRPPHLAGDLTQSISAVQEFLSIHKDIENVGLIQCTSVFLKERYLQGAWEKYINRDCVFSVVRSFKLRWKWENNELRALNFNPNNRPRRQDWNGELLETGMFYFARRKLLMEEGAFQNEKYV